jgi:Fe-S cluster biogenesis protein NfuA
LSKEELEKVIEEQIRPLLRADGGDLLVEKVSNDGSVYVRFTGRCAGCPGSSFTLSSLVERCLVDSLEDVKRVVLLPWKLEDETS